MIFLRNETLFHFGKNLPISSEYKLGPGDEIIISMWGESNSFHSEIINRDEQVFLDNVGILNLGGKSLVSAKKLYNIKVFKSLLNFSWPESKIIYRFNTWRVEIDKCALRWFCKHSWCTHVASIFKCNYWPNTSRWC